MHPHVIGSLENFSNGGGEASEPENSNDVDDEKIHFLLNGKFNLLQEIVHNKTMPHVFRSRFEELNLQRWRGDEKAGKFS